MHLQEILAVIMRHSTLVVYHTKEPVHPNAIMFTYGASDELEDMMRDLEEEFGVSFDGEDVCEIGEMKVSVFIDKVEQKIKATSLEVSAPCI